MGKKSRLTPASHDQHLRTQNAPSEGGTQIKQDQPRSLRQTALRCKRQEAGDQSLDLETRANQAFGHTAMCECQPVVEEVEIGAVAVGEVRLHDDEAPGRPQQRPGGVLGSLPRTQELHVLIYVICVKK